MTTETSSGFPVSDKERQEYLIHDYLFGYFPDSFLAELEVAIEGNRQHNPGERLHWAREKSTDHMNKAMRHIWLHGRGEKKDDNGRTWHLAKAIWRLKAQLQLEIELERSALMDRVVYDTGTGERTTVGVVLRSGAVIPLKGYELPEGARRGET